MTALDSLVAEARERLVARAFREGAARVAVDLFDSPLGPLWLAVGPRGVLAVHYGPEPSDSELRRIVSRYGPGVLREPRRVDPLKRELDDYFGRRRTRFEVPVDLSALTPFQRRILSATRRIPFGKFATYREIATRAGTPAATRAAGGALGANPIPIVVPCHRVIASDGTLGGYTGGLETKRFLLALEHGKAPPGGWERARLDRDPREVLLNANERAIALTGEHTAT